ncbi:MAG: hypothetical protein MUC29_13860 [Pyrinomonadaceae bacterium]|jgi:hypothetical protein|nr:hypothetical protein [Pyrinomonadaceae bacterium]
MSAETKEELEPIPKEHQLPKFDMTLKTDQVIMFDANALQTLKVAIPFGDESIDGTITFQPLKDNDWLDYYSPIKASDDELANMKMALQRDENLWNALNPKGDFAIQEWEDYLDIEDKQEILRKLTIVRIKSIKRTTNGNTEIVTECYFNGKPCDQTHILRKKMIEDSSKYKLIESKQFKTEAGKGLGDEVRVTEVIPQDVAKAELYDDIHLQNFGFVDGNIPIRFKTLTIDNYFTSKLGKR